MSTFRNYLATCAALALASCALPGCSSKSDFKFDQMDLLPVEEELTEFSLGEYKIPIPLAEDRGQNRINRSNRLQFEFLLYALVSPKEQSQFQDAWSRHEGEIR